MRTTSEASGLGFDPRQQMFMTLRDIGFWVRSARADARLAHLRRQFGSRAFDPLYDQIEDPWGACVECYRYQRRKYDILLSLLPARHYANVVDLGCGRGEMTRRLAPYVGEVLGLDLSSSAVEQARRLSSGLPNIRYEWADVLALDPALDGQFDLVVLADTLYYLSPLNDALLKRVCERMAKLLAPAGVLLLVNHFFFGWDPDSRTSRTIHDVLRWWPRLHLHAEHQRPFYLTSILEKL